MAMLDEFKDKAGDVVNVAGKKMGDAYNVTKVRLAIADKQSSLRNLYKELGEIVYRNYKGGDDDFRETEDKIAEIDLLNESIEELRSEYRQIKNIAICPSCRAEVAGDMNYCPRCGAEMQ